MALRCITSLPRLHVLRVLTRKRQGPGSPLGARPRITSPRRETGVAAQVPGGRPPMAGPGTGAGAMTGLFRDSGFVRFVVFMVTAPFSEEDAAENQCLTRPVTHLSCDTLAGAPPGA